MKIIEIKNQKLKSVKNVKVAGWGKEDDTLFQTLKDANRHFIDGEEKTIGEINRIISSFKYLEELQNFIRRNSEVLNKLPKNSPIRKFINNAFDKLHAIDIEMEEQDRARIV